MIKNVQKIIIIIIKKILNLFKIPIDFFFFIVLIPSSLIMLFYRKFGSHKLPISKKVLNFIGIFPLTDHYYEPQFNFKKLNKNFNKDRNLTGINFCLNNQLHNLSNLIYKNELIELKLEKNSPNYNFNIHNSFFERGDAEIYYQLIRQLQPKNILEIGSGHSTLIALEAIKKNKEIHGAYTKITCVEPYENDWLKDLNVNVLRKKIEDVDEKYYLNLKNGDILFIDSSHIIRPQGDVLKIFLEIVPRLNKGVLIQIHDIFTPKDYPEKWVIKENKFWNEQYLVESIIMNNNNYEIYLMLNYLKNKAYKELKDVCPYLKKSTEPGSIYLLKK
jgi:predicted O-methyltransferase YrrM